MLPNVAFGFAGNRNRRLRALIVMIVLIIKMRPVMTMMISSIDYFPENTFDDWIIRISIRRIKLIRLVMGILCIVMVIVTVRLFDSCFQCP